MPTHAVIRRATADVAAGRLWMARDRLTPHLATSPTDQAALELLGEVLFAMRDLVQASRYWQLTDREGADVDEAMAAFEERYGQSPVEAYRALPLGNGGAGGYPEAAAARIEARRTAAIAAGYRGASAANSASSALFVSLAICVGALSIVSLVVGLVTIVSFVVRSL
jgi:hypothetical protein